MPNTPATIEHGHEPVLSRELLNTLKPQPGDLVADCTCGRGGHSELFARAVQRPDDETDSGVVVGFDLDPANLDYTTHRLNAARLPFVPALASFGRLPDQLGKLGRKADVVLADLGFSSNQMADPERGFSFTQDGPLDMRMDPRSPITAAELIATLPEQEVAEIIHKYGEEPLARRIARNLAQARREQPIQTTAQLAELVRKAYGSRAHSSRMHPATRTFMALRIAVNDELGALRSLLGHIARAAEDIGSTGASSWLNAGARIGIISFHSLEDRIVKHRFQDLIKRELAVRLTKKPVTATEEEICRNPRARSAKFRAVRIAGPHSTRT